MSFLREVWRNDDHWVWHAIFFASMIGLAGVGLAGGTAHGAPPPVAGPTTTPPADVADAPSAPGDLPPPPGAANDAAQAGEGGGTATAAGTAAQLHQLRVRKATRLVLTFHDYRNPDGTPSRGSFLPWVEHLISTHERLEAEGGPRAAGFGAAWFWSMIYGSANFGLRCYATAPGSCAGPMDVKHSPRVIEPAANIEWHCREMLGFYKRGVRGRDLCEHVFYPARPHDWGGGRFRHTERRFRDCIQRGYEVGKLP